MVRIQVDGNGNYIFRPSLVTRLRIGKFPRRRRFCESQYEAARLTSSTGRFEIFEPAASENFVPTTLPVTAFFRFISRTFADSATAFEFHGAGSNDFGQPA